MTNQLITHIEQIQDSGTFSGTILVQKKDAVLANISYGYANRADRLLNHTGTRFGIASGCKIFTAVAICQLIEEGKLSADTKLHECLDVKFPHFDHNITVHQLLTHTSGVPDYFDEDAMGDFEQLWIDRPMYHMRTPQDFLPLFQHEQMKFAPGERFEYNNAGFILLGLIIEKISGMNYSDYVQSRIFEKAGMRDSGYFELDALPGGTATGYIDREDGTWRTNIYSLPAKGGPDGGAFVTAPDMIRFWDSLMNFKLLSQAMTMKLLTPHTEGEGDDYYGYGVWIGMKNKEIYKYHVMGYDPGICFHSAYYPETDITLAVCANISIGAYRMMMGIEDELGL
ncbi:serine hydrolase domain-containing protein [Paenibacillus dakarensis]|uniref:serine hydrolase domain-containing protein n=1 Tax=Paenibacillus dakarensis TaxID=1527293 RepID=UPI0006D52C80|nr:serine hydrolase [Paenibacillus dakarensis]